MRKIFSGGDEWIIVIRGGKDAPSRRCCGQERFVHLEGREIGSPGGLILLAYRGWNGTVRYRRTWRRVNTEEEDVEGIVAHWSKAGDGLSIRASGRSRALDNAGHGYSYQPKLYLLATAKLYWKIWWLGGEFVTCHPGVSEVLSRILFVNLTSSCRSTRMGEGCVMARALIPRGAAKAVSIRTLPVALCRLVLGVHLGSQTTLKGGTCAHMADAHAR